MSGCAGCRRSHCASATPDGRSTPRPPTRGCACPPRRCARPGWSARFHSRYSPRSLRESSVSAAVPRPVKSPVVERSPPYPVGVPVSGVPLAAVDLPRCFAAAPSGLGGQRTVVLAERDHPGGAAVDTQGAPGALVLVDDEEPAIGGVGTGVVHVARLGDGVEGEIVDALPRADVDAALAEDALGLVDVEVLLRLDRGGEGAALDEGELIVLAEGRGLEPDF